MEDPLYVDTEAIAMLLKKINNGNGIRFVKDANHETRVSLVAEEQLVELGNDATKLHVVCIMMRTGAEYFYNHLEYTYFPPMTPTNDEYDYYMFKWQNIIWVICSIPIEKKNLAEQSAKEAKMKLADGIPFMAGPAVAATRPDAFEEHGEIDGLAWFPMNGDTVFTLENASDGDVTIYDGKGAEQDLQAEYDFKLNKLYEEKHRKPPQ